LVRISRNSLTCSRVMPGHKNFITWCWRRAD
jgi:hypothetical protein